ncbi:hypothetical protein PFISCL1PPCAC_5051, partial [Pristionchus fissidentatus]
ALYIGSVGALDTGWFMEMCRPRIACNQTAIVSIFIEDAKRIGKNPEGHASTCLNTPEMRDWNSAEQVIANMDSWRFSVFNFSSIRFNDSAQVVPFIKQHFPASYYVLKRRMKTIVMELDSLSEDAVAYGRAIKPLVLDAIVRVSQSNATERERSDAIVRETAKLLKEAVRLYEELPHTVKTELEMFICLRTKYRAFMHIFPSIQAEIDLLAAE